MRQKVTVVGAGQVGGTTALHIFQRGYADVVLMDILEGLPQGKALDILQSGPIIQANPTIIGTNGYEETANSDLVVITSGVARKPGMSRDDLLYTNMEIIGAVTKEIVRYSPNCVIVTVTNPLDAMTQHAYEVSGLPKQKVIGQSGVLDTARFRTFIAQELNVAVQDVNAYVLGGHGDTMVPLVGYTTVGGIPVADLIPKKKLDNIVQRTRDGGAEIVGLLKTGSAFYAPAAAVAEMVDAILLDQHRILPCAAYLEGEYGINGLYSGVPVKLSSVGIEEIITIKLSEEEEAMLKKSAAAVQELIETMRKPRS
jgi:malate dehydrogenase